MYSWIASLLQAQKISPRIRINHFVVYLSFYMEVFVIIIISSIINIKFQSREAVGRPVMGEYVTISINTRQQNIWRPT